ncbi:MAG: hypothetical protein PWQ89_1711 [Verrucomicrobiota bacterium]|jgi:hypothetical protein|nr:hypothetical protein [Verrucomicrobiota bacterium]
MKDYHANVFCSEDDDVEPAKEAWLTAARRTARSGPSPRSRPVIYQLSAASAED